MNEFRQNPLTGSWIFVADNPVSLKEECLFCGDRKKIIKRFSNIIRQYDDILIVPNLEQRLSIYSEHQREAKDYIHERISNAGAHEIVIESPCHKSHFYELSEEKMVDIFRAWQERVIDLKRDQRFHVVDILKKEKAIGNEHALSEIFALPRLVSPGLRDELVVAQRHFFIKQRCLVCDLIHSEQRLNSQRVIFKNENFIALFPYAPQALFHCWIFPIRHQDAFEQEVNLRALASAVKKILLALVKIFASRLSCDLAYDLIVRSTPKQDEALVISPFLSQFFHYRLEIKTSEPSSFFGLDIPLVAFRPETMAEKLLLAIDCPF